MILILGGTAEARDLARHLVAAGLPVTSSLAGRVQQPALPVGEVRIGGFGGVTGLAHYLRKHDVQAVVDATHPFAARISAHAAAATIEVGRPLLRLQRPGWSDHPQAHAWRWVDSEHDVLAQPALRPVLTTGRQTLDRYLPWSERDVLARVVDPPAFALPTRWRLIRSRGPYGYADERDLLANHRADLLVTKDSGGAYTAAKLDAAADLAVPVVVVRRPAAPAGVRTVSAVDEAVDWVVGLR